MKLYYLPLSNTTFWGEEETMLLHFLSEKRQVKVQRYVHVQDRLLSLYAALLVRMTLSMECSLNAKELIFAETLHQKPVLLNNPNIHFNFSHTHDAILCGLSTTNPIGVDIEKITSPPLSIADTVFHSEEIAALQMADSAEKASVFFRLWTRKEAYVKQTGTGLADDFISLNTLSPSICSQIYSWNQDAYSCSACDPSMYFSPVTSISCKDIQKFFLF